MTGDNENIHIDMAAMVSAQAKRDAEGAELEMFLVAAEKEEQQWEDTARSLQQRLATALAELKRLRPVRRLQAQRDEALAELEIARSWGHAIVAEREALRTKVIQSQSHSAESQHDLMTLSEETDEILRERDALLVRYHALQARGEQEGAPDDRSKTTYLHIIGGLLELMLFETKPGKTRSGYDNQAKIIEALQNHFSPKRGLSKGTLERKFAAAKKALSEP